VVAPRLVASRRLAASGNERSSTARSTLTHRQSIADSPAATQHRSWAYNYGRTGTA
jgi:hypothetical protein